jgi:S-adenosylmethionine hydrolase
MIVLFTDFGRTGPYVGQMHGAILRDWPAARVVDLFADAPVHDPRRAAYLLAAYAEEFPPPAVFVCVVDPEVGGARQALALEAGGRWFVGPDNGLLAIVARRAEAASWRRIVWRPERLSASFHGRDLFAPLAAKIVMARESGAGMPDGWFEPLSAADVVGRDWPDDLAEAIYVDGFGNVMIGLRAAILPPRAALILKNGRKIAQARTFSDVPRGEVFWYENANGLAEIAMNCGRASSALDLTVGASVKIRT